MPKCHNGDAFDDSYLQSLSTEDLEAIAKALMLPADLNLEENNLSDAEFLDMDTSGVLKDNDISVLTRILDILVERDGRTQEEREAETRLQWERLVSSNSDFFGREHSTTEHHYLPPATPFSAANTAGQGKTNIKKRKHFSASGPNRVHFKRGLPWNKATRVVAMSALAVLLFGGAAVAFNPNIREAIGQWSMEAFQLGQYKSDRTDQTKHQATSEGYDGLLNELTSFNIETPLVPKQLPEGLQYGQVSIMDFPDRTVFAANNDHASKKEFGIIITRYEELPQNLFYDYEKMEAEAEKYVAGNNITHYILSNYEQTSISWLNGNCEVNIAGDFTLEEAKLVINSVY